MVREGEHQRDFIEFRGKYPYQIKQNSITDQTEEAK